MANNVYYVQARPDAQGTFAVCSYFTDVGATQPASLPLQVPPDASSCLIGPADGSELLLIGSVFKTIGAAPALNNSNYCPTDDNGQITVSMPTTAAVTKGVVLLFADPTVVTTLYPSEDPEITNTPT
jgi:hypothetical protein